MRYYIYYHFAQLIVDFSMPIDYGVTALIFHTYLNYAVFFGASFNFRNNTIAGCIVFIYHAFAIRPLIYGDPVDRRLLLQAIS